jgi:hypothetical protein
VMGSDCLRNVIELLSQLGNLIWDSSNQMATDDINKEKKKMFPTDFEQS